MRHLIGKKVLITTHEWFLGTDGRSYKAVWGDLVSITEAKDSVGFAIHRSQANWFIEIGDMVIAGCQVLYLMHCPDRPETGDIEDWSGDSGKPYTHPSSIWACHTDASNKTTIL